MKHAIGRWLTTAALLLLSLPAHAVISCSVTSPGFNTAYNPAQAGNTVVQSSFTVNCTRAATDPTTATYYVVPNNGANTVSNPNRSMRAGSAISYDTFRNSTCSLPWTANFTDYISGNVTFPGGSQSQNFWGCVTPAQNRPAGTYTDIVTLTLYYNNGTAITQATSTFPVNIATPATCAITTTPGAVAFGAYVAFGGALNASAGFGATCTQYLPYTISVGPTGGTIAGLGYTLLLGTVPATTAGTSLNMTGTGVAQSYTIDGAMPAGQPGTCPSGSCSGSVPHTLTLTY